MVGQAQAAGDPEPRRPRNLTANFTEEDSDQPPGTVIRTDPAAGGSVAKLPQGGSPTVSVGSPAPLVPVPDVTSLDPPAARRLLADAGFQATEADVPSDTVPAGKVIRTQPGAGTPLPKGTDGHAAGLDRTRRR